MSSTRLLLAAALALATVAGVLVAARRAHPSAPTPVAAPAPRPAPTTATPAPPVAPTDADAFRTALAALDRARAAAFADPAAGDPDEWAAPACVCHAEDAQRLRTLARDGLALRATAVTVASLTVLAGSRDGPVDLLVVDRLAAYTAVDRRGRVVRRWPATGPRRWRIRLLPVAGRWLLGAVARAP